MGSGSIQPGGREPKETQSLISYYHLWFTSHSGQRTAPRAHYQQHTHKHTHTSYSALFPIGICPLVFSLLSHSFSLLVAFLLFYIASAEFFLFENIVGLYELALLLLAKEMGLVVKE